MEDKLLIWKLKNGSKDALCRVYEKYEGSMLASAVSILNDVSDAEDAVHDAFVSFAQSVDKLKLYGNLKGYLMTCVVNRARDKIRAKQRYRTGLDKSNPVGTSSKQPSDIVIRDEELRRLSNAMAKLPYEQREAIAMHLQGGMTFRTIAKLRGVSVHTIWSRYRYGLKKLRSVLNSKVVK